jgi:hypothetical protein
MNTLTRIDEFRRLWGIIIEKIACPTDSQILRWQRRFDDAAMEHALNRLAAKVRRGEIISAESAGKYVTAVLLAEEKKSPLVGSAQ